METVGKQVQVVSGLGVGGPVGPVGPVGGDLHHHHHPHPHAHPPHPHSHPHGHPHGSHGHSLATSNPGRGQPQPPTSHNQHVPARSTPVQLHRSTQNYANIKSSSPVSPRTIGTGATYVQGGAAASSAAAAAAAAAATASGPAIAAAGVTATSSSGLVGVSNVLSSATGGGGGGVNSSGTNNSGVSNIGSGGGGSGGGSASGSGGGSNSGSAGGSNNGSVSGGSGGGGGGGGSASGSGSGGSAGGATSYVTVPMLRYIHSYPPTSTPAVAAVVTTAPSLAAPVPVPVPVPAPASAPPPLSQPTVIASQTPPPPLTGTSYAARDAYRAGTTNVNERLAINVSNSPLSQVGGVGGVGVVPAVEYSSMGAGGRSDRQRISLLPPVGSSVTSIPSPSAVAASDYQQHAAAARNPPRAGLMPVQPDQYCSRTPVDMSSLQQDAPPFKKIRLGPHQQVQQLQSQPPRCLSPADPCGGKQDQQQHVQLQLQPLRIDTREQPAVGAYTPQTEAISPTLPEPNTQEDAQYRSTKDDLLQQIGKVDREIAKRENQLNMLRKRLKELEETANKPLEVKDTEEQSQQPKHQSMAQKVYAENRRKAEEAHRLLERLGPKVELPLYNQPSDTSVYQENRTRHQTCMRARLIARLRREHAERASLHRQQSQTYAILVQEWHRKVERLEATQKRKSKETKNREFFEKVFPELRKQREDKERFNRVGARIKSEADLEEIMDGLQEQEEETLQDLKNSIKARQMEDKKMRSYAVIPPLLLDAKQRRIAFQNRNGLLQPEELEALHSERKLINVWSSVEHELFKEKYLQHPKNYGVIAQSLEHKSVPDCVHHYYLTKKAENYKQLLRKSRQRTRSSRNNPNNKVNNTSSTIGPIDILTTGVTTRLQREQQQKTQENPQNSAATATSTSTTSTTVTSSVSSTTVGTTTVTTTTTPLSSIAPGVGVTTDSVTASTTTTTSVLNTIATSSVSTTSTTPSAKDSRESSKENKENKVDLKESHLVKIEPKEEPQSDTASGKDIKVIMESKGALSSSTSSLNNATNVSTIQSDFKESSKKKPGCRDTSSSGVNVAASGRIKDKKKENHTPMETSDEEAPSIDVIEGGRQIGPHACTVCQSVVDGSAHSRALPRSQASQYGLREDQVPPGARVCNTCRCKAVRGRYTACPLPGCPNLSSSKSRVKRLRALPSKWLDLPPEVREPIAQEFQIPNSATKCCSACFSRISRRLAPHLTGGAEVSEDGTDVSRQWTDEELDHLRRALREHGTNWPKVAEQIPGKTNHQCKNYYFAYRKKLSLDQVVAEYYASLGEDRRPCLTDEEESGSSTSSCDELAVHDSSDTASAGSPATTMTGNNATSSGTTTSSSLPMSFQRSTEQKPGEKLSDLAVSLVPPGSSHQSTSSGTAIATSGGREDYDSSATETADEGQGGADLDNGSVVVTLTSSNNNTTSLQQQSQQQSQHPQPPPIVHSPPSTTSNSNPITVKDLMLGVIEMQLKRTPNSPADGGGSSAPNSSSSTPTISSILKTDHRNDITYVRGYKSSSNMSNTALSNREAPLATLSVVSGPHHAHRSAPSPQQIGQMQATITPCPPAVPSSQTSSSDLLPKEGLVVMQVQQALRETEGTLDLSIKKPRLQQDYNHSMQLHKPPTVTLYRPEPPPGAYYHPHAPHPEQGRGAKSPLIYASSPRPQAPITPKMNKVTVPPPHPKLSPKLSNMGTPGHKGGSITHGTPVSTARYEGLLRQMTPPGNPTVTGAAPNANERGSSGAVNAGSAVSGTPKDTGGSITQGTPVLPFAVDKRGTPIYDYHRTIRHSPVTGSGNVPPPPPGQGPTSQTASPAVVVSHGGSQYNSYSTSGRPPPSYTMEQQLSSRQIIMNDYITSQQMHARARSSSSAGASVTAESTGKSEPPPPPTSTLYYTSTPPPSQTHTQARQGVIQRHNTQKQIHYPPPPPGLEAFSSLVDVAVQQPSLPVPHPHSHPAASGSGGHEGLGKTMADRLLADRYDNNRAFREQEIRIQEHRMAAMQAAEHRLAVAAAAVQHQRDRDRERDLVHLREKEEQRLHREKELQQLEHRLAIQQHHQQREKDLQQQEHRLAQREKEMHAENVRLSIQQVREKDIQHEHRLSVHQREKEMHQHMVAAAAQREKEHEHRLAVQQQREKEMQQQEQRLAMQQQREKEHAEHRLAVQQAHRERDLAHLHQQQQQQQQQQQHIQHIQQQRIEAERRHIAQLYRDQQIDRDSSRLLSSGYQSRLQQSQQSQQQQQQQSSSSSSSSRQSQSSNQPNEPTLTAASLIDAIITHQINQGVENCNASGSSANQPARAGDRLFQGFHRETQQEPNGIAHSPAGEGSGGGSGGSGNGSGSNKAITLGEHVDHIVSKDYGPPHSSYRSYGYQISEDQWKRRKMNEPDSVKTGDERQIIRVAQQQPTQQQQQHQSSGKQQYHSVEPVSPPEATTNHYGRRFYESSTATSTSGTPSNKPHQISPFDYVKNKIVEVMRTEDDKVGGGGGDGSTGSDRNGGGNSVVVSDKDEKGANVGSMERSPSSGGNGSGNGGGGGSGSGGSGGSGGGGGGGSGGGGSGNSGNGSGSGSGSSSSGSGSGGGGGSGGGNGSGGGGGGNGNNEMVVDDAGGPNPTTREQAPPPPAPAATTTFYPFSALGVHTGPPPAPPPTTATSASVTKSEQMQAEPAPLLSSQYEPLSDED